MDVLLYGRLGQQAGRQISVDVPAGGCAVTELRERIADQHPRLREEIFRQRVRACVNDEIVADGFFVMPGQTVEFFPPVSGG